MNTTLQKARPIIEKCLEIIATVREANEIPRVQDNLYCDYWSVWGLDDLIIEFTELCDGPLILTIGMNDTELNRYRYYSMGRCFLHYDISLGYEDILRKGEPYETIFYEKGMWEKKINQLYDNVPPERWKDEVKLIVNSFSDD